MFLKPGKLKQFFIVAVPVGIALASIAWSGSTGGKSVQYHVQDTVPGKMNKNQKDDREELKDLDYRIEQLNKTMENLNQQLDQKQLEKMQQMQKPCFCG